MMKVRKVLLNLAIGLAITGFNCSDGDNGTGPSDESAISLTGLSGVGGIIPVGADEIAILNRTDDLAGVFRFTIGSATSSSGQLGTGLPPNSAVADSEKVYTLTSDYSDGYLSTVTLAGNTVDKEQQLVSSDATICAYDDNLYFIQRGTGYGKVTKVAKSPPTAAVAELTGLTGDNAHDIAFASSSKAYLSRYEANNMWIFNPATMMKTGEIDLSAYVAYAGTDSAGSVPSMSGLAIQGNNLFVACQRMMAWIPRDISLVLVVDTDADTVLKAIPLQYKNPYRISLYGDKLYVACLGGWGALDGGVEVINTTTLTSEGVILTETDAGGDISGIAVVSPSYGYLIVAGTWPANTARAFNPADGTLY